MFFSTFSQQTVFILGFPRFMIIAVCWCNIFVELLCTRGSVSRALFVIFPFPTKLLTNINSQYVFYENFFFFLLLANRSNVVCREEQCPLHHVPFLPSGDGLSVVDFIALHTVFGGSQLLVTNSDRSTVCSAVVKSRTGQRPDSYNYPTVHNMYVSIFAKPALFWLLRTYFLYNALYCVASRTSTDRYEITSTFLLKFSPSCF